MESLEERVARIEGRNTSVELDKAWETSWARTILILVFTYIVVGIFLTVISVPRPWISALVPVIAFMLSSLTMPIIKKMWVQHFHQ